MVTAVVAVALDVFIQFRIFSFNLCDVLQAHDVALGVGIYNLFCHIPLVESITEDNVESNCSMTRKNPPKGVSFSDLICIFAMLCQSFACFLFATLR